MTKLRPVMPGALNRPLDEPANAAHNLRMERIEKSDSQNRAVRAIERWKRGVIALIFVALAGVLPAAIALAAGMVLVEALNLTHGWWPALPAVAALIVGPWCIGQRKFLRTVGSVADLSDK